MVMNKGQQIVCRLGTPFERRGKVMNAYPANYGKHLILDVKWEPNPKFDGTRYEVLAELCQPI